MTHDLWPFLSPNTKACITDKSFSQFVISSNIKNRSFPYCFHQPKGYTRTSIIAYSVKIWLVSLSCSEWSERYSEPCKIYKMGHFTKIVNCFKRLSIFVKCSILIVWQGFCIGLRWWSLPKISLNGVRLMLCAGSNPTRGVSELCNGVDLIHFPNTAHLSIN